MLLKFVLMIGLVLAVFKTQAQSRTAIYLVHGQGSDQRLFDSLQFDTSRFEIRFLNYSTPSKGATMNAFAHELAQQIDTTVPFILVGTSLGGMLCCEMQEFLHPEKVILISSATNRNELPFRYRFQRAVPLYAIFPPRLLIGGAKMMQPLVEPDRKHNKVTFKSMLAGKNGIYMKRTIRMIIRWERTADAGKTIRIHGTNDHTIPIRNIDKPTYVIKKGSHMITLTRAEEISGFLREILKEEE